MPIARLILCCLAALCCAAPSSAESQLTTAEIVANIQQAYETTNTLRAAFVQTLTTAATGAKTVREGEMAYKKPQHIRWQMHTPEPELLLVTPESVWNYFPDEGVAYRYPVEQVLDSRNMLRFISGEVRLDEDFYIERLDDADGDVVLEMAPKEPEPSVVLATARIDPDSWLLRGVTVVDFYNNENSVLFTSYTANPKLPDGTFSFSPPEDVDVMDNRQKTVEEKDLTQ